MKAATILFHGASARDWLSRYRERMKPVLMFLALALFCGGLYLSLHARPDMLNALQLRPLLLIFFLSLPAGMVVSAFDFQLLARLSDAKVPFWRAGEIVVFTRAANMLPIPGSFAVRMAALKVRGVTLLRSGKLMLVFTIIWAGMGFAFSAFWLAMQTLWLPAFFFGAIGGAFLWGASYSGTRLSIAPADLLKIALLRFALVALDAFSLLFALQALSLDVSYQQTAILVAAGFVSFLVPAGIGVRETAIAILSPLAGIDPASGFLAASLSRITGMTFLALCASASLLASRALRKRDRSGF
jgi:hypothetical protein